MMETGNTSSISPPTPPHWHTITPSHKETLEWIESLYGFISAHRLLCDAHTVDFFTCNHWENVVPEQWKREMGPGGGISDDHIFNTTPCSDEGSISYFLNTARSLSIPLVWGGSGVSIPDQLARFGMTAKKSHEVTSFSEYVTLLTSGRNIHQVLDVGSGKGYLSQHLALRHGLCVVGVDAQQSHTQGARQRNKKVYKAWKCVSQQSTTSQSTSTGHCAFVDNIPDEINLSNLFEEQDTPASSITEKSENCSTLTPSTMLNNVGTNKELTPETVSAVDVASPNSSSPASTSQSLTVSETSLSTARETTQSEQVAEASFIPITQTIATSDVACGGTLKEGERGESLLEHAETLTGGRFSTKKSTCLVGLHTCGDLGGVALRLFLRQPQFAAVCVVGCCYHHITEKEDTEYLESEGFPMSGFLRSHNAVLGRISRMLACQAASRLSLISSGEALESVFRRAVLQVVLQRSYPDVYRTRSESLRVGKMRRMPESFPDYAFTALKKLGLDTEHVSPADLLATYSEFEARKCQLSTLLKLRAVLASCVESLLLLDRLLFLKEQESTSAVSLVQLFDPEISPRCLAIVATKP